MLHLRIIAPTEQTQAVVELLRGDPATANLAVLPAAALDPPGDLVLCDLARRASTR